MKDLTIEAIRKLKIEKAKNKQRAETNPEKIDERYAKLERRISEGYLEKQRFELTKKYLEQYEHPSPLEEETMLELEKALKNAIDQTRKASYDKLKIDESAKLEDQTKIDESAKLEDQTKIDESNKLELSNVNSTEDSRPGSRVLKAIGAKWTAKYTQK
jgi:hypothetical protein